MLRDLQGPWRCPVKIKFGCLVVNVLADKQMRALFIFRCDTVEQRPAEGEMEWFFSNAWYIFMIEAPIILILWDITGTRKD